MRWVSRGLSIGWMLLAAGFSPAAWGAEYTFTPTIGARGEYNDNVFFSRTVTQDDFILSAEPSFGLGYANERWTLNSRANMAFLRYVDNPDLNYERVDVGLDAAYAVSERFQFTANAFYAEDETLESQLEETGVVGDRSDRSRYSLGGGALYRLTEMSDLSLDLGYGETEYDETSTNQDAAYDNVSLTYNRRLANMRDMISLVLAYDGYDSEASKVNNWGFSFGWAREFSETLSLSAFVGVRYTDVTYRLIRSEVVFDPSLLPFFPFRQEFEAVEQSESNWGGLANIALEKRWETVSLTAGFRQDLVYSAAGEPIDRQRLYLTLGKRISTRLNTGLSVGLYRSESSGEFSQEDSWHFSVSPSLSYRLTENHRLAAGYGYDYHHDNAVEENAGYDRNRVWVAVTYRFPKRW